MQVGYGNGHNHLLNAAEYHRSSEINITITEEYTYDTDLIEAFFM